MCSHQNHRLTQILTQISNVLLFLDFDLQIGHSLRFSNRKKRRGQNNNNKTNCHRRSNSSSSIETAETTKSSSTCSSSTSPCLPHSAPKHWKFLVDHIHNVAPPKPKVLRKPSLPWAAASPAVSRVHRAPAVNPFNLSEELEREEQRRNSVVEDVYYMMVNDIPTCQTTNALCYTIDFGVHFDAYEEEEDTEISNVLSTPLGEWRAV